MQEAKDESKTQREACSVCGAESRRECPCGTRRYCSRMAFARAQDDSTRCPVCEEIFDPNYYKHHVFRVCCCKLICERCDIAC
ncbi:hypothetical protein JL720_1143 [Aureococcus anophagefferens]|nr:hypothetical protein JL720_1143 [Aureococcus anophagefferens]